MGVSGEGAPHSSPKQSESIRPLEPVDAEALAPMIADLGYPITPEIIRERLPQLEATGFEMLVTEIDGRVAGCCSLSIMHVLHRKQPVGRISMMVVDRALRGKGIGARLVAAAEERLRACGCGMIEVTSALQREDAHRFYERLGYVSSSKRFAKPAPGEG